MSIAIAEYVFGIKIGSNCLEESFTRQTVALHYPTREPAGRMLAPLLRLHAGLFHGEPMVESTALATISLQLLGMNTSIGFIRILIATSIAGFRHVLPIVAYTVAETSGLRDAEQGLARGLARRSHQAALTIGALIASALALTCSADKLPNPEGVEVILGGVHFVLAVIGVAILMDAPIIFLVLPKKVPAAAGAHAS
jgi:hypothetical protein